MEEMREIPGFNNYLLTKEGRVWSSITSKWIKLGEKDNDYGLKSNDGKYKRVNLTKLLILTYPEEYGPKEETKPIEGYDGKYVITKDGRIWSYWSSRWLVGEIDRDGYIRQSLLKDKKLMHYGAHRLVWETWIGAIPEGLQIDHINRDRKDNRLENLRLVTPKGNSNNPLTREYVKSIWTDEARQEASERFKKMWADGKFQDTNCIKVVVDGVTYNSASEAARACGVSDMTVRNRCANPTFANYHFEGEEKAVMTEEEIHEYRYAKVTKTRNSLEHKKKISKPIYIDGIYYNGMWEAAEKLGIDARTISSRIASKNFSNYCLAQDFDPRAPIIEPLYGSKRAVIIDGVEYESCTEAGKQLGLGRKVISHHCNSDKPKYSNYKWKERK